MSHVDPALQQALVRLVRTLGSARRGCCLIGALVPRLLMAVPPAQRTRDIDVVVEDAPALTEAARDVGHLPTDQRWRTEAHQLLQWYCLGASLRQTGCR